ncbi:MAG: NAD(P)H-hydrate dehydratase [Gammaproteobacteria bacterium]|nr:NAD(P)H-hydrate dehydratase [Gammaproteobacteria bacterium]
MDISENFIFSAEEVSSIDSLATNDENISGFLLMRRAAEFSFDLTLKKYPNTKSFLVFCGTGNNAGDGYLFASHAIKKGLDVSIIYLASPENLEGDALKAFVDLKSLGAKIVPWTKECKFEADIIIDALFGIGLNRIIEDDYLECIKAINGNIKPVIAMDIPSGLCANTGREKGIAIKAVITFTFVGKKIGMYLESGPDCCGDIYFSKLSIPENKYQTAKPLVEIIDDGLRNKILGKRAKASHKGNFGHVLIVGGNKGMGGAARIAAEGAIRSGAGLVSVITRAENVNLITRLRPEIMCHAADEKLSNLKKLLKEVDVIAIGPGLGIDEWAHKLYAEIINTEQPLIVDADALNILSLDPIKRDNWILTPHPGEAAKLISKLNTQIQSNRLTSLEKIINQYQATVILKGNNTLVGNMNTVPYMIKEGNPGMSSAGMGDLLTGLTAGLLAQYLNHDYCQIAALAAFIHAKAGDQSALNGQRGLIATDLLCELRPLLNP